jgi:hypothetical protein
LYRALETFALADRVILEGTRLREPVGPAAYWIVDSADDADEAAAKQALYEDREAAAAARQAVAPPQPPMMSTKVKAIRSFTNRWGYTVKVGDVYDAVNEDVLEAPEAFEAVPD